MASLDLGTLVAHIRVEGANAAQSVLRGVSSAMGQTSASATGATSGTNSFMSSITSGLSNVNIFGTNLGTLATAFGGSEVASIAMGTALGGVCTAGILAAVAALKGLISACVEFVTKSYDVGVSFQQQMSKVGALSMSTGQELDMLTTAARQFGKDTVFSASQAAQALEYTALAGYNAGESIEVLPGILNLAAASSMDLARASDIITNYLKSFNMGIDESTHLADVMAYTMTKTNTSTEQLGEAYKSCASTATAFGLSCEETSSWLGVMADRGIKGSEAGTALNAVLARLYGETETANKAMKQYGLTMYESNGKSKNFTKVIGEMQEAMKGMSEQQKNVFLKTVAGVNHLSDFAAMLQVSAADAQAFTIELENCGGAAEKMAKKMTDNIAGLQEAIGGKIENIQLSLFTAFEPLATGILKVVDSVLGAIDVLVEPIGNLASAWLSIFTPILDGIARIGSAVTDLAGSIIAPFANTFASVMSGVGSAVQFVVDIIVSVVEIVIQAISPIASIIGGIVDVVTQLGNVFMDYLGTKLQPVMSTILDFLDGVKEGFLLLPNIVITAFNGIVEAVNYVCGTSIEKIDYLTEGYAGAMESMGDDTKSFAEMSKKEMIEYAEAAIDLSNKNYSSFEEMYNAIRELDSETFGQLQSNAEQYMSSYEAALSGLSEYESAELKKKMQKWEDTHKSMEGSMNYYIKKAEYQAEQEEKIARKTADKKEDLNNKYTSKMEQELKKQQGMYEQYNSKNYEKDYKEFASNEEAKTKKFQEESKKRHGGGGTSFLSGVLGAYANGTDYVPSTGRYLVGEHGPEIVTLSQGASVTPNHKLGGTTQNTFNVSINASSVREFTDIVNICSSARMTERMA